MEGDQAVKWSNWDALQLDSRCPGTLFAVWSELMTSSPSASRIAFRVALGTLFLKHCVFKVCVHCFL